MKNRLSEIAHKLKYANPVMTEVWVGMIGMFWGLVVINPWFDTTTTSRTLQDLIPIAPKYVWGSIIFICGFVMMFMPTESRIRAYGVLGNFCFWSFLTIAACMTSIVSLGVPLYGGLAISSLWVYFRRAGVLRDPDSVTLSRYVGHRDHDHRFTRVRL